MCGFIDEKKLKVHTDSMTKNKQTEPKAEKLKKNGKPSEQGEGGGRPRAFPDLELLKQKIDLYFTDRETKDKPVSMIGLGVFLEVGQRTIGDYIAERYDTEDKKFSQPFKRAKDKIASSLIDGGLTGDYNSNFTKFLLSANHAMNETHQLAGKDGESLNPAQTTNLNITSKMSAEDAAKIYRAIITEE